MTKPFPAYKLDNKFLGKTIVFNDFMLSLDILCIKPASVKAV